MSEEKEIKTENTLEDLIGADLELDQKESLPEIVVEDPKSDISAEKRSQEPPATKNESEELRNLDIKINKRVDVRVSRLEKSIVKKIEKEREAYMGAIETVTARVQEALDKNDLKAYAQANQALESLEAKKEELESDLKVIKEDVKENIPEPEVKKVEFDESAERWIQNNKKFVEKIDSDPELSALAKAISTKLVRTGYKDRPQIELLTEVKKRMLQQIPEEFAGIVVPKDEVPNVSGGKMDISSTNNGGGKKVYTINDVPSLDRQILKNLVTNKVYKDEKEAVTKYFQRKQQESR